jgi:hypothetical protein
MKVTINSLAVALLINSTDARSDWKSLKKEYDGDKFAMRWYSYVPEEDPEEGAVFAPTLEVNFKEAIKETDVVRLCLAYRDTLTKDSTTGALVASTIDTPYEIMCAYTKTSWKDQEW